MVDVVRLPLVNSEWRIMFMLCASFTIKSYDYGQDFCFITKRSALTADKTLK